MSGESESTRSRTYRGICGVFIVLRLLLFRKEPVEYIVGKSYPACLIVVGTLSKDVEKWLGNTGAK